MKSNNWHFLGASVIIHLGFLLLLFSYGFSRGQQKPVKRHFVIEIFEAQTYKSAKDYEKPAPKKVEKKKQKKAPTSNLLTPPQGESTKNFTHFLSSPITPEYPEISKSLEEEGTSTVRLKIDRKGKVLESVLIKTSGYKRLDDAAMEAAQNAIFPSRKFANGQMTIHQDFNIIFKLVE